VTNHKPGLLQQLKPVAHRAGHGVFVAQNHLFLPFVRPDVADEAFPHKLLRTARQRKMLVIYVNGRQIVLFQDLLVLPAVEQFAYLRMAGLGDGEMNAVEGIFVQGIPLFFGDDIEKVRTKEGLNLEKVKTEFGIQKMKEIEKQLSHFKNDLIKIEDSRIKLTDEGMLRADGIASNLFFSP
jgi:hypothetical protein